MSYTFLQEQGEESSAECFSDIPASVLLRSTSDAATCCCNVSATECCRRFQSGTTLQHLTARPGAVALTWYVEDFHAKTFPPLVAELELMAGEAVCGVKWHGLSVKYDRESCSWKTHRCLYSEDLEWSCLTLPKWGSMRDGELFRRRTPDFRTDEPDCGFMPTLTRTMVLNESDPIAEGSVEMQGKSLRKTAKTGVTGSAPWPLWMLFHGWTPTPKAAECFMGWPMGWTDLQPLVMDRFRQWLRWHGEFWKGVNNDCDK